MPNSKFRIAEYRKRFAEPNIGCGRVEVFDGKFERFPADSLPALQLLPYCHEDHYLARFDEAVNLIKEEYKGKARTKCLEKYKPSFCRRVLETLQSIFHRSNGLRASAVFYIRRDDGANAKRVNEYRARCEENGLVVRIEYSEQNWYRSIEKHAPILTHCFVSVDSNPVVNEKVRLAVFDFDGSAQIAKDCAMFCRASLGYSAGLYQLDNSHNFFLKFYKLIISGESVFQSYHRVSESVDFGPSIFQKNGCKYDFKVMPYKKSSANYKEKIL